MNDHSISSTINPAVAVREAGEELLDGILRNNRGTKLECHLLDTALILGRPSTRGAGGGRKRLQVGFILFIYKLSFSKKIGCLIL